jgi:hypothetical protein
VTFELYASGFKGGVASGMLKAPGGAPASGPGDGARGAGGWDAGGRGGNEAEAPRRDVNISTAIKPTPTQMAMSATLKVGQ